MRRRGRLLGAATVPGLAGFLLLFLDCGGSGFDLGSALDNLPNRRVTSFDGTRSNAPGDRDPAFTIRAIFDDVQATWEQLLGDAYQPVGLVFFSDSAPSTCGGVTDRWGLFYCPDERRIYVELAFMRDLNKRSDAPGDYAQAFAIAHEVGHHIQQTLGIEAAVQLIWRDDPGEQRELWIREELQADCFAGIWAASAPASRGVTKSDHIQIGLVTVASFGDDRLQSQGGAAVNQETWTHGSSDQRMEWFRRGFETGNPSACDTFSGGL